MEACWMCGLELAEDEILWIGGDGYVLCAECDNEFGNLFEPTTETSDS